jgi:hypothetical protein
MHFGIGLVKYRYNKMQMKEIIEDIVTRELKGLCISCAHTQTCPYRKSATKVIIQCEFFQLDLLDLTEHATHNSLHGLCATCDHANHCTLPGRKEGVWRCNDFS